MRGWDRAAPFEVARSGPVGLQLDGTSSALKFCAQTISTRCAVVEANDVPTGDVREQGNIRPERHQNRLLFIDSQRHSSLEYDVWTGLPTGLVYRLVARSAQIFAEF